MKNKKASSRSFGNEFEDKMPKSASKGRTSREKKSSKRRMSIYDDFDEDLGDLDLSSFDLDDNPYDDY
ncbi:hypothetical protein EYV94_08945 [Puteibacter caeruleilacunae]|nr:hypothetical protein EYV94_08945 [Puteibacter caeruleilacunae]